MAWTILPPFIFVVVGLNERMEQKHSFHQVTCNDHWEMTIPARKFLRLVRAQGRNTLKMRHPVPQRAKYSCKGTFFPSAIAFFKILPFEGTITLPDVVAMRNMLRGIYHVIKDGVEFRDLGEDYLTQRNKSLRLFNLQKQAQSLGFNLVPKTT
jgi:hypothetical protein